MRRSQGFLLTHRALALICLALALMSAVLAWAWSREHRRADCWQAVAEDDQIPPDGPCRRL